MTLTLTVPNMACSACVNNITNAVKTIDAGAIVEADTQTKLVSVETQVSQEKIKDALTEAGYPPA